MPSFSKNEVVLADWAAAGLHVSSTVKRGIYTIHASLIVKSIGRLSSQDCENLERSIRAWLGLT